MHKKVFKLLSFILSIAIIFSVFNYTIFDFTKNNLYAEEKQQSDSYLQNPDVFEFSNQWIKCNCQILSEPEKNENGKVSLVSVTPIFDQNSTCYGLFVLPNIVRHDNQTYDLIKIGENAFDSCEKINQVYIPQTVYEIDSSAFSKLEGDNAELLNTTVFYCVENSPATLFAKEKNYSVSFVDFSFKSDSMNMISGESIRDSLNVPDFIPQLESISNETIITYSSSNEEVATIDSEGIVSSTSNDNIEISANFEDLFCKTVCQIIPDIPLLTQASIDASEPTLTYKAHVQNIGWQNNVNSGEIAGTTGKSLRLEALQISLTNGLNDLNDNIVIETHVSNIGWQDTVKGNEIAGTTGKSYAIEAIRIQLSDSLAESYDIYYCLHIQNYGWLNWASNGESAGSEGLSYRAEAIKILLLKKGEQPESKSGPSFIDKTYLAENTKLSYACHVQNIGWQNAVRAGQTAGTSGQSLRMEALKISLSAYPNAAIRYRAHVQNIGWQDYAYDGSIGGTTGQSLRVEAIQIDLLNWAQESFDIYYRCHIQNLGWMDWACNGETAGSCGASLRMEAIEIVLVEKGGAAPGKTAKPCYDISAAGRIVDIALGEVGYKQNTSTGYTKYGEWYSSQVGDSAFTYADWCAMFVSWCANQAGISRNSIPLFAWVPTGSIFYKNVGQWHASNYIPKNGDIIFFEWDGNMSARGDHVGIVQKVSNGRVYTIEGNCDNPTDGGKTGVTKQKDYSLLYNCILGYGSY